MRKNAALKSGKAPAWSTSFSTRIGVDRLGYLLDQLTEAADRGAKSNLDLSIDLDFHPSATERGQVVVEFRVRERRESR